MEIFNVTIQSPHTYFQEMGGALDQPGGGFNNHDRPTSSVVNSTVLSAAT